MIHEMISNTRVPTIYTMHQYGLAEYKGSKILILPDAIYDFDTERFFMKHETLNFYFMGGNDGITVEVGDTKARIDDSHLPHFGKNDDLTYGSMAIDMAKMYK